MKLSLGLIAAIAGCASAAAQQAGRVYLFNNNHASKELPSVSRSLARLLFLQRLSPANQGPRISDVDDEDTDRIVDMLNIYGKPAQSILATPGSSAPSQLVLMLDGMTAEQMDALRDDIDRPLAYTIRDPPSTRANQKLMDADVYSVGIENNNHGCPISQVVNPFETKCWTGHSTFALYHVDQDSTVLDELKGIINNIKSLARAEEMETTLVLLPSDKQSAGHKTWAENDSMQRRAGEKPVAKRQAEMPISSPGNTHSKTAETSTAEDDIVFHISQHASIPACFDSADSCIASTGNCSAHGECRDKYASSDGTKSKTSCFTCHCLSTVAKSGSVTHWAGPTCQKKDVSTPFWLFAGFTLVMVGVLTGAIALLFNVGEEKLPGVIGAGVSRTRAS